jgi:hypothetical protein
MPMIHPAGLSTPHRSTPSAPARGGLPYPAPFTGAKPFPQRGFHPAASHDRAGGLIETLHRNRR